MAMQSMATLSKTKRSSSSENTVKVTRHINRGRTMLVFYLGSDVCKQAGMEYGDKLDVMWDEDTLDATITKEIGGKTLTMLRNGRGVLSFTWREGMPIPENAKGPLEVQNLVIEHGSEEIHFTFPEGCL